MSGHTGPAVWDQVWAIADRIEGTAWQLMGLRERPEDLVKDAGRALVVEVATLNRLGFRLASDAIDRALAAPDDDSTVCGETS